MKKVTLGLGLLIVFASGIGSYLYLKQKPELSNTLVLPEPRELPAFKLTDNEQQTFTNKNFIGNWSLLFFGYTNCPDVCPTELYMLAQVIKDLEQNRKNFPKVFLVSLDPVRDTPDQLKSYVKHFHPDFTGLTGEQAQIDKLAMSFGVIHEKVYEKDGKYIQIKNNQIPAEAKDKYLVNHSARILIVNPDGKYFGTFSIPHEKEKIVADLQNLKH